MSSNPGNPLPSTSKAAASSSVPQPPTSNPTERPKAKKRKGHRGGKKKRSRRKSFAVLDDHDEGSQASGDAFYQDPARNLSSTSIDSQVLLDHRGHQPLRPRRASTAPAPSSPFLSSFTAGPSTSRLRSTQPYASADDPNDQSQWDEGAALLGDFRERGSGIGLSGYGTSDVRAGRPLSRRTSNKTSPTRLGTSSGPRDQYDVNNPPSMPGSPRFGPTDNFGDAMLRDELSLHDVSPRGSVGDYDELSAAGIALRDSRAGLERRMTAIAEKDVCFPGPGMSEIGEDETQSVNHEARPYKPRKRRGPWPDLSALEDWSHMEKEGRTEERRVKRVTEPQLINGRLRPVRKGWSQAVEESPYRFTYFNEELQSTIHSQTISELIQPGGSFRELFIPDRPILSDDESDEDMDPLSDPAKFHHLGNGADGDSKLSTRQPSMATSRDNLELRAEGTTSPAKDPATAPSSRSESGRATPSGQKSSEDSVKPTQTTTDTAVENKEKVVRYGDRPVWWLDVLCPTDDEMMILSKAFGIHPLTGEDILMKDPREKVELFRHYYFVNYRTFNQDSNSETFLDPVDMYVLVFREGVLSFHFAMTPHAANVRRRIRQLQDYVFVSSDWISYAIIDDITDAFQPLIKNIENEVDDIDDEILMLHSSADKRLKDDKLDSKADDSSNAGESRGDMLQRVGDCRKRVMNLYRLLGNKADVIKGFAKRCNERWEVAPRSEIGLYLGDIQDHIVTMTSNLSHYEGILARSHANYLAQINIRMNERQEQTADVLGKLTVLGTIVLPMNIITGLWGMNVWVPGQEYEGDLTWFAWITAGLIFFGLACFMIAKRVYNIV
ncbi:Fc.00g063070.m01.CDS01 [Cosmosporella sp. VM-42]